jgi:putative addiction module CopG family antidote
MTFRIVLDRQGEEFVQRMLDSKRYECASDVVLHALELLKDEEVAREARRAELLASIDAAIADIDENGGIPAEEVFAELDEIIRRAERQDAAE